METYETLSSRAVQILGSAHTILNSTPNSRDMTRATAAIELASVYASLADTAARVEAAAAQPE